MAAPNEILAKGCPSIDAYLNAYIKNEKVSIEVGKLQQDSEATIALMSGNQQATTSCGLSANARKFLDDSAMYQGSYEAIMADNTQAIIDYFGYIRSQQGQQSQLGAIIYPDLGKSINVSGNSIIVQDI